MTGRALCVLLVLGLVGCGQSRDDAPGGAPASSPEGAPSAPSPLAVPAAEVLTEQDDGARVALPVGQEVPLRLDGAWDWREPVIAGAAVTATAVDYLQDPGFTELLLTGTAPGTATVEVAGEPACGDPAACPATAVRIIVEVRAG